MLQRGTNFTWSPGFTETILQSIGIPEYGAVIFRKGYETHCVHVDRD